MPRDLTDDNSVAYRYRKSISIIELFVSIISIYIGFLATNFLRSLSKFTGWAIIEELSIRRRVRRFLSSWGQRARVKVYNSDLSSWYVFWFALICIDMNVISALSTAIQQFRDGFDSKKMGQHRPHGWSPFFIEIQRQGKFLSPMRLCSGKMWKSNVKNIFSYNFPRWPVGVKSYRVVLKLLRNHLTRQQNGPKLEILQTAIRYMFDY